MSRSNLLRKIRKDAQLSASQFIRNIRLEKGMEMLREKDLTVSEVSYEVGFGSTSYFIKCFREHFGYPPGEALNRPLEELQVGTDTKKKHTWKVVVAGILAVTALSVILIYNRDNSAKTELEKSIAVLPFKNESADSSNVYFVNGLMESTLNNLQKIEDLRVVSRTSSERYRNTVKGIPEIARDLGVNFLVEGSGQKMGNQVLLHIQLIEASSDHPVWSQQYNRRVDDIFALQNEIAREISGAIEAVVTPDELAQIEKQPTEDLQAYDDYLRGVEYMWEGNQDGWDQAIQYFEKAIERDPQFSLAYAEIAIAYFFKDQYKANKQFTEAINTFADKALLYDSKSAESLIAKALYYMQTGEYRLALPHLEKALEYNPNSVAVIQILADFYARIIPDTEKYLEYALKGIQLNMAADDSTSQSFIYLSLSNALVQNGFVDQAIDAIDQCIALDAGNYFIPLIKPYILYAKDQDAERTKLMLLKAWQKDTTRLDILQEIGKFNYFEERYDRAFYYYKRFVRDREAFGLNIYPQEDIKIGIVYEKMGLEEEAAEFIRSYEAYCERDESIYKSASTAVLYAYQGEYEKAMEQLRHFSTQNNIQYWILLFLEKDPVIEPLKSQPGYEEVLQRIRDQYWENHNNLRSKLEEQGLM